MSQKQSFTETFFGVSFEAYLRGSWDEQRDVATTSPQRYHEVLLPGELFYELKKDFKVLKVERKQKSYFLN